MEQFYCIFYSRILAKIPITKLNLHHSDGKGLQNLNLIIHICHCVTVVLLFIMTHIMTLCFLHVRFSKIDQY